MIKAKQRLRASLPTFDDYVKSVDLPEIGRGLRGVVYELPGEDRVLKLFRNDPSYFEWVLFCEKHQTNPYIPRIRKLTRLNTAEPNCYSVEIEKLKPVNQYKLRNFFESVAAHYGFTLNVRRRFIDWFSADEWAKIGADTTEDISVVARWFSTREIELDLNHENVRVRGNQFVFADPVF